MKEEGGGMKDEKQWRSPWQTPGERVGPQSRVFPIPISVLFPLAR